MHAGSQVGVCQFDVQQRFKSSLIFFLHFLNLFTQNYLEEINGYHYDFNSECYCLIVLQYIV